jgi:hypothetical protein
MRVVRTKMDIADITVKICIVTVTATVTIPVESIRARGIKYVCDSDCDFVTSVRRPDQMANTRPLGFDCVVVHSHTAYPSRCTVPVLAPPTNRFSCRSRLGCLALSYFQYHQRIPPASSSKRFDFSDHEIQQDAGQNTITNVENCCCNTSSETASSCITVTVIANLSTKGCYVHPFNGKNI